MNTQFANRLDRLRAVMIERGVSHSLFSVGPDLPYLTGYEASPSERITLLVVSDTAEPTLLVPRLEAPKVEAGPFHVHPWGETEDPLGLAVSLMDAPGTIAIGDHTWATFLIGLQERLPAADWIRGSELLSALRVIKDTSEKDALRLAGAQADEVARRIPSEIKFAGETERTVARRVAEMLLEEGHDSAEFGIIASGPNGASPHHTPGDREVQVGDLVVIDFGGRFGGYCSDTTRTFSVGDPSPQQAEVHGIVLEAQTAARASVKAGVACEQIDASARSVIEEAGYGDYFIHRTGHGIGREVHEDPYLVDGNDTVLRPGMAFSIEPGIYLPGEFGVRIEDICLATDDGIEVLNNSPRELVVVG